MKTYIVEKKHKTRGHDVVEYCHRLCIAKAIMFKQKDETVSVLAIEGPTFGEGYHQYRLIYRNDKIKRVYNQLEEY